ncbi:MAG TPA: hypothetical protein VGC77_06820 [Rhodopseudomonas sp.]|uniref:hypothetical protein n=1 Tax=Rhodopseudomonas sp. TaxID=1078 RepID=UPI002ED80463
MGLEGGASSVGYRNAEIHRIDTFPSDANDRKSLCNQALKRGTVAFAVLPVTTAQPFQKETLLRVDLVRHFITSSL